MWLNISTISRTRNSRSVSISDPNGVWFPIYIVNDLPFAIGGSQNLIIECNFYQGGYILRPGVRKKFLSNYQLKTCLLTWSREDGKHIAFNLYNFDKYGGFSTTVVLWSVRYDAIYHSFDNVNWEKREIWDSI